MSTIVLRLIAVLALNAIPFYGVLVLGWTPGTLVLLFAFDVMLSIIGTSLRIRRHERDTGDPQHRLPDRYRRLPGIAMETLRGVFWRDFFDFAFSRAVILGMFAYGFPLIATIKFPAQRHAMVPDWTALALGAAVTLAVQVLAWASEAGRLRHLPFAAVQREARACYVQVLLLCAIVMVGMFAVLGTQDVRAIAYVLIGLKLATDAVLSATARA